LSGTVQYFSASATFFSGKSITKVAFGLATGDLEFSIDPIEGWDLGIDLMYGYSYCREVYSWWN
jgi:hypothetical protein